MNRLEAISVEQIFDSGAKRQRAIQLRQILKREGAVYLPKVFAPAAIEPLGKLAVAVARELDLVAVTPSTVSVNRRGMKMSRDDGFMFGLMMRNSQEYKKFLKSIPVQRLLSIAVGPDWRIRAPRTDGTFARMAVPNKYVETMAPHQDSAYGGTREEYFTLWIPLHRIPKSLGGLGVLPGTHRQGNLHGEDGRLDMKISRKWIRPDYRVGDAIIISSYCVHGPFPNTTKNSVRFSIDITAGV